MRDSAYESIELSERAASTPEIALLANLQAVSYGLADWFRMPMPVASLMADALQFYIDNKQPLIRQIVGLEDRVVRLADTLDQIGGVFDEMSREQIIRGALTLNDLELLLTHFIGRPETSIEEIRKISQQQQTYIGPVRDYQPKRSVRVSDELRRSIREGRIGDPREPGSDG